MESIKIILLIFLVTPVIFAAEKEVGTIYFTEFMGHVHKNPSKSSSSVTTIQCAHPLKVLADNDVNIPTGWVYVRAGDDRGFVASAFLNSKRPECFQDKYPRFFINLNLDLTDMYYWGKLYDQYDQGESRIK
jgi:hypothetical protein